MKHVRFGNVLILLLAVLLALPLGALAAPGDITLFPRSGGGGYYGSVAAAELALKEEEALEEEATDYVDTSAILPDGVYAIVNGSELRYYQVGDEAPKTLATMEENQYYYPGMYEDQDREIEPEELARQEKSIHRLVAGDDGLYGLNLYTPSVAKWNGESFDFLQAQLDLPGLVAQGSDWTNQREFYACFIYEGSLYLLLGSEDADDYQSLYFYSIDLTSGKRREIEVDNIRTVFPYKPGKLLVGLSDMNFQGRGRPSSDLAIFDIASSKVEGTYAKAVSNDWYSMNGYAYDPATDCVYFTASSQVQKVDPKGKVEGISFLATNYVPSGSACGILEGGYYALATYDGIFVRNLDPQYAAERALRIAGGWDDSAYHRFSKDHPEIPVLLMDDWFYGVEQVSDAIQGRDQSIDIFVLGGNASLRALMEKGYTLDLSGNAVLAADVESMYPEIQRAVKDDQGRLMAYPQTFYMTPWFVNLTLFEEHFPGEEVPETFEQFFDLLIDFNDRYDEDYEVAFTSDATANKMQYMYMVLSQFILMNEDGENPVNFQDPSLRAVMEKIDGLDLKTYDWENMTSEELDKLNELYNRPSIFNTYGSMFTDDYQVEQEASYSRRYMSGGGMISEYSFGDFSEEEGEEQEPAEATKWALIPPPVFEPGQEPVISAYVQVYIVNPISDNQDLALQYLEYAKEYMDDQARIAIHPDMNEPVRQSYYLSNRKSEEKYIAELEEALETANEEERRDLEDSLKQARRWLEESEKGSWYASEQAIEVYRQIAPYMTTTVDSTLLSWDSGAAMEQISEILTRYESGQLNLDAMLREIDGKARMIYLEGK